MIREMQYIQGAYINYSGSVGAVSLYCDGGLKQTLTGLPEHDYHLTRRITFNAGFAGFVNQLYSDHNGVLDYTLVQAPVTAFQEQRLWHYYDVTYNGDITVEMYLDENKIDDGYTLKLPNIVDYGSGLTQRQTHTLKIFMPPLAFGRVPHLVTDDSKRGQILNATPVALPARFYNKLQSVDEISVTYAGEVGLAVYMDGMQLGDIYNLNSNVDSDGRGLYTSEKFYLSEGGTGTVFQWEQVSGYGDIVVVETNATLADMEPTTKAEPT
jgi:hypothetical protein